MFCSTQILCAVNIFYLVATYSSQSVTNLFRKKYCYQNILSDLPFVYLFTERRNGVILTYKVESLVELKFDPGFRVIGEYLSKIDSILRVNFKFNSQYLVNLIPITRNSWSNFSSTRDSTLQVKMTPFFSVIILSIFHAKYNSLVLSNAHFCGKNMRKFIVISVDEFDGIIRFRPKIIFLHVSI